jgi:hypothetical protein
LPASPAKPGHGRDLVAGEKVRRHGDHGHRKGLMREAAQAQQREGDVRVCRQADQASWPSSAPRPSAERPAPRVDQVRRLDLCRNATTAGPNRHPRSAARKGSQANIAICARSKPRTRASGRAASRTRAFPIPDRPACCGRAMPHTVSATDQSRSSRTRVVPRAVKLGFLALPRYSSRSAAPSRRDCSATAIPGDPGHDQARPRPSAPATTKAKRQLWAATPPTRRGAARTPRRTRRRYCRRRWRSPVRLAGNHSADELLARGLRRAFGQTLEPCVALRMGSIPERRRERW